MEYDLHTLFFFLLQTGTSMMGGYVIAQVLTKPIVHHFVGRREAEGYKAAGRALGFSEEELV